MTLLRTTATLIGTVLVGAFGLAAQAADGLIAVKSPHTVAATADKLAAVAAERGLKLFARVDHAAGAASINQKLRPTEVLIFGNPQGGTPFMACQQSVGIDLPLKALVWQDEGGQVWLGYNDPAWLATRHGAGACPVVPNLAKALAGLAAAATAP
ncbi:MAG: DUF302 domain-containing protein [Rubrivivax sp.]|nr:DUF302 domain-containing protein [Rubrivivax sp.]